MTIKIILEIGKRCLFVGILIGNFFISEVKGEDLIREIVALAKEERELDNKIVAAMPFELVEDQMTIAGDNEKYMLKDVEGSWWSFKPDSVNEIRKAEVISNIAQLLGVNIPVLRGITLSINGRKFFGSIQKIGFHDILRLEKILIKDLFPQQILSLQKLQVFDWLFVAHCYEIMDHCFIASKSGDEIWGIDKDDFFRDTENGKILGLDGTDWENSLYHRFWAAYLLGKINIEVSEVFELINYIQHIENNELKKILGFLSANDEEKFLTEIIRRKNSLRKEFKKFYCNLAKKRGETLHIPLRGNYKDYVKNLLKKKKKQVLAKKLKYKWIVNNEKKKQKDIEVVSSRKIWDSICSLFSRKIKYDQKIIEETQTVKKKCFSITERLAIELYRRQLKTKQKLNIYRIIKHPDELNPAVMECNLRISNYDVFVNNNLKKIDVLKNRNSVLSHLRYIAIMKMENRDEELTSEYTERLKRHPRKKIYLFLLAMCQAKYFFNPITSKVVMTNGDEVKDLLNGMNKRFPWKYYGFALCDYSEEHIQEAIDECEKIINLNKDRESVCAAYMLMGFLCEHNGNVRFGTGFDLEKAITNYKKTPKSSETRLNLGILYLIEKSPKQALKEFKKVKKLEPEYAQLYFHLDNIKRESAYQDKDEYLEAIRINTLSGEDHYILGLVYAVKKQNKLAKKHFDKAREFGYKVDVNESKKGFCIKGLMN